ncbi:MAG: hypothetical protein IPH51_12695 [Rubrivivax sp.]|nr:hypothetical protein [Rubrivivax sp.]
MQKVRARMVEPFFGWVRVSLFQDRIAVDDFACKVDEPYVQDPNLKGLGSTCATTPAARRRCGGDFGGLLPGDDGWSSPTARSDRRNPRHTSSRPALSTTSAVAVATRSASAAGQSGQSVPLVVPVNEGVGLGQRDRGRCAADHKRAATMGVQTFGAGSVQTVRPLSADTGAEDQTTARYFTPSVRSIRAKGIAPEYLLDGDGRKATLPRA